MDENENEIARIGPPRPPLLGGACTVVATPTCQRPILETDALRLAPPAKRLACLAKHQTPPKPTVNLASLTYFLCV